MTKQASPKQFGFIRRLVEERVSQFPEGVDAFMVTIQNKRLTGQGASAAIDALLAMPADAKPAQGNRDMSRRSNAYPGRCILCGHEVAAGAGYLVKDSSGRWAAEHLAGECVVVDPNAPVETPKHKLSEIIGDLPDGRYAVPSWTGNNDISFWLIKTNKGIYHPEKKGQRIMRQVTGHFGDDGIERFNYATAEKVVAAVRSMGVKESMALYGTEIGECGRCGRTLTSDYRKLGIGPECIKKF